MPVSGRAPGGGNTTRSSVLAWKIPWTEEPCGLESMGLQRATHDRAHTHKLGGPQGWKGFRRRWENKLKVVSISSGRYFFVMEVNLGTSCCSVAKP